MQKTEKRDIRIGYGLIQMSRFNKQETVADTIIQSSRNDRPVPVYNDGFTKL